MAAKKTRDRSARVAAPRNPSAPCLDVLREVLALFAGGSLGELEYEDAHCRIRLARRPPPPPPPPPLPGCGEGVLVRAPVAGVVHAAPPAEPSAALLPPGSEVHPGQALCVIESRKLVSEVDATLEGQVAEVLVQPDTAVTSGQPLFRIRPR